MTNDEYRLVVEFFYVWASMLVLDAFLGSTKTLLGIARLGEKIGPIVKRRCAKLTAWVRHKRGLPAPVKDEKPIKEDNLHVQITRKRN